jgi:hypothetical protein
MAVGALNSWKKLHRKNSWQSGILINYSLQMINFAPRKGDHYRAVVIA